MREYPVPDWPSRSLWRWARVIVWASGVLLFAQAIRTWEHDHRFDGITLLGAAIFIVLGFLLGPRKHQEETTEKRG